MTPESSSTFRSRLRLAAACVLLIGLAMAQSPGLLVSDTKFDLAVTPGRFLARATHLWDPLGAGGQLQNQAYGYLWPMGPFFLLGSALDVPGWAVQRLWLALVMCVALIGAAKLARALGIRSDLACIVAGFAYALSPRMLTTLGPISIEAWPSALAPWVLLPLVIGAERGSARRAAALSALAVAMVGGVNAAAAFAVLPLGVLWLLLRTSGRRRRTMMFWWPVFTMIGTLWWLVPLFVLGLHSPPFLDYIESASNTTFSTTLFDSLRGTSDWVPYVDTSSRAGNDLIRLFYLPIDSGVVLFLGMAGLLHRANPHRLFLAFGVLAGLFMVTIGHLGSVQGWWAGDFQALLDGALAPLRNVHKFDPILRLPLVLGMAWLVDRAWQRLRAPQPSRGTDIEALARRLRMYGVVGTAVVAVLGASLPAVTGQITPAGGLVALPDYWSQTATWLKNQPDDGQALLVPGSSFGTYVWGSPKDEPLQALARSPWAVRNAVPLTPPGNIRMLDAIEARMVQGLGSPGLSTYLRRAGFSYLVVRNDLARSSDIPDPVLVHQAIQASPGLRRLATFGPDLGGEAHLTRRGERVLVNGGWQNEYPAIEVYGVTGTHGFATESDSPPTVVGGPEDLLDLADLGVLGDQPTQLATDVGRRDPAARLILTDGLRAVERNFGRDHDGASATVGPGDPRRLGNPTRDYLPADADRWSTTARIEGVKEIGASSSMSDANAIGVVQAGQLPFAAMDGHPESAWKASFRSDAPGWWQVTFDAARRVNDVRVTAGAGDRQVIRVRTAHGVSDPVGLEGGASRTVAVGDPSTTWLRVEDASGRVNNRLSLAEVSVPGVLARRSLHLPLLPTSWGNPDQIVLRAVTDDRLGCADVDVAVRCVAGRQVASEEPLGFRRIFNLPRAETYDAQLQVRARPGNAVNDLVMTEQLIDVDSSSAGDPDPRASVLAAVDGDPGTTWTASLNDARPLLNLNWIDERRVAGLRVQVAADSAARLPQELLLTWPDGRREVSLDKEGRVTFPAIRTKGLTIRIDSSLPATSLGFDSSASPVPVGIGELTLRGVPYLPIAIPEQAVRLPCGSGPTVTVDGEPISTSVTASQADLYAGKTVPAELCGSRTVRLTDGENRVDVLASDTFTPTSLVLTDGQSTGTSAQLVASVHSDPTHRSITPAGSAGIVSVKENANSGWSASQGGKKLAPVLVDGWQQGWRLSSPGGRVTSTFSPDLGYRLGLFGGLVLLIALAVIPFARRRWWNDTDGEALQSRDLPAPVLGAVAVLAGGLLAGWTGFLVAVLSYALASLLARRAPEPGLWLFASAVLPAAGAYALRPWGGADGWAGGLAWPQYLVVVVLVGLFAWPADRTFRDQRFFRRIPGFSTRR